MRCGGEDDDDVRSRTRTHAGLVDFADARNARLRRRPGSEALSKKLEQDQGISSSVAPDLFVACLRSKAVVLFDRSSVICMAGYIDLCYLVTESFFLHARVVSRFYSIHQHSIRMHGQFVGTQKKL